MIQFGGFDEIATEDVLYSGWVDLAEWDHLIKITDQAVYFEHRVRPSDGGYGTEQHILIDRKHFQEHSLESIYEELTKRLAKNKYYTENVRIREILALKKLLEDKGVDCFADTDLLVDLEKEKEEETIRRKELENKDGLTEELERRIQLVENGAEGVSPMKKKDYIMVAVVSAICFIGILIGAFL